MLFDSMDKDGDGNVSGQEWGRMVTERDVSDLCCKIRELLR